MREKSSALQKRSCTSKVVHHFVHPIAAVGSHGQPEKPRGTAAQDEGAPCTAAAREERGRGGEERRAWKGGSHYTPCTSLLPQTQKRGTVLAPAPPRAMDLLRLAPWTASGSHCQGMSRWRLVADRIEAIASPPLTASPPDRGPVRRQREPDRGSGCRPHPAGSRRSTPSRPLLLEVKVGSGVPGEGGDRVTEVGRRWLRLQLASAAGAAAHIWRGGRAQSGYDRRSTRATGLDLAGEGGRLARPSRAPERAEGQGGGRGHRRCHIVARGDRERGWGRERERASWCDREECEWLERR
jgi:hypothetical protein